MRDAGKGGWGGGGGGVVARWDRSRWIQGFPAGSVTNFVRFHGNFGADPQFSSFWDAASLLLQAFQWKNTALTATVFSFYEGMEFPGKTLREHPPPIP